MPSAFTHILAGAAAVQLLPSDLRRLRVACVLGIAAALPDLDVAAFLLGIPYAHPLGHRGLSHSLLVALVAGAAAGVLAVWDPVLIRRHSVALVLAGFLAVASHGLLDAATNAGLGIGFFVPLSGERYFFPFRPIETASVNPRSFLLCAWMVRPPLRDHLGMDTDPCGLSRHSTLSSAVGLAAKTEA